jgi:lysophospholipase L1-like esterase
METPSALPSSFVPLTVACLGASHTEAKSRGSYDWIADLRARSQNAGVSFVNLGIGGDLAYSALQRVPHVIACHPGRAVVLVGTNDVVAAIFPSANRFIGAWKRLPQAPTPEWYAENLRQIVRGLRQALINRVALCSLAPIGEDPDPADPLAREVNRRVERYSAIVQQVAQDEGTFYIPFYERMNALIQARPGRAFTSFSFLAMYRDAFKLLVLRRNLDEIGLQNGYHFHSDGIHLNSASGKLLADLVQEFVAD